MPDDNLPIPDDSSGNGGNNGGGGSCDEYDDLCWMNLNDNNNDDEDECNVPNCLEEDEVIITISRDDLIQIANNADLLMSHYETTSALWAYGTGTVLSLASLFVDGLTCVSSAFTLCLAAIGLTVVAVPAATYYAGAMGGGLQADNYEAVSEYLENVLINDSSEEFTITISQHTDFRGLTLPGGVRIGTTFTVSNISINGYSESLVIADHSGNVMNSLFGGGP